MEGEIKRQTVAERSTEIRWKLEQELDKLDAPCSIADMMKRVGASRLPTENHLAKLLQLEKFAGISMVRIGGTDIIYRKACGHSCDKCIDCYEAGKKDKVIVTDKEQASSSPKTE